MFLMTFRWKLANVNLSLICFLDWVQCECDLSRTISILVSTHKFSVWRILNGSYYLQHVYGNQNIFEAHNTTMVMFPQWKAQVKLSDDPRTPVNLFPVKGDLDCSPYTACTKRNYSPCFFVSHSAYKPLGIKFKIHETLISAFVDFRPLIPVSPYIEFAPI